MEGLADGSADSLDGFAFAAKAFSLGFGTSEVESFGSYLHRIAYEHGVFVGELLRFVYRGAVEAGIKSSDHVLLPKSFDISEAISGNQLTATLVDFFEWATGQPLESGTFIKLNRAVGRSSARLPRGFSGAQNVCGTTWIQADRRTIDSHGIFKLASAPFIAHR